MAQYKLTYFDGLGLGEPIRLLLHYLDQPFEDVRMTFDQWTPEMKQSIEWGKVPTLEIDGTTYSQVMPICRYLAKKADLAGQDDMETLLIDMYAGIIMDMRGEFLPGFAARDEQVKKQKLEEFYKTSAPYYLSKFDKVIKENNGYIVNGKLSWTDILLCSFCDTLSLVGKKDVSDGYENIKSLRNKFNNHPRLKNYIKNRPKTDF